jgi:hypothetical protein
LNAGPQAQATSFDASRSAAERIAQGGDGAAFRHVESAAQQLQRRQRIVDCERTFRAEGQARRRPLQGQGAFGVGGYAVREQIAEMLL